MNRALLMLAALETGDWRSRSDLFNHAKTFYLTNNAASELRALGHNIEQRRYQGNYEYRLSQDCSDDTDPPRVTADARVAADPSSATSEQLSLVDVWRDVLAPRDTNVVYLHDPDRDNYSRKVPA